MDERHAEYVAYYESRLAKYKGNPLYPHCEAAEQALYDAIANAPDLEAFKRLQEEGKLTFQCALARVKDTEIAKAKLYRELEEEVRAGLHEAVLAELEANPPDNEQDLVTLVADIHTQWHLKIAHDESFRSDFWGDFKVIEDIEEDAYAEVPERWRAEKVAAVAYELDRAREHFENVTVPEARKFFPEWEPDWDLLWASRHRRRFPVSDRIVESRMQWHERMLLGGE